MRCWIVWGPSDLETLVSLSGVRKVARRFSRILVKSLLDDARFHLLDPVEQYRLGKVAHDCIQLRFSLLGDRRGPKWSEEKELRRMERQIWSIMARLDNKKCLKDQSELARFRTRVKRIKKVYRSIHH